MGIVHTIHQFCCGGFSVACVGRGLTGPELAAHGWGLCSLVILSSVYPRRHWTRRDCIRSKAASPGRTGCVLNRARQRSPWIFGPGWDATWSLDDYRLFLTAQNTMKESRGRRDGGLGLAARPFPATVKQQGGRSWASPADLVDLAGRCKHRGIGPGRPPLGPSGPVPLPSQSTRRVRGPVDGPLDRRH